MGFINLLHNGYRGKLGETVGQKWKNQLTLRTYQETNNSKSEAQLDQRAHYKALIGASSKLYPFSAGWSKSMSRKMNTFNLFTHVTEKLADINLNDIPKTKISVFTKTNVFAATALYSNVDRAYILYESPLLNRENYTKVKLVLYPYQSGPDPRILGSFSDPATSITPVSLPEGNGFVRAGNGFMLPAPYIQSVDMTPLLSLAIPTKGGTVFTTLQLPIDSMPSADIYLPETGPSAPVRWN